MSNRVINGHTIHYNYKTHQNNYFYIKMLLPNFAQPRPNLPGRSIQLCLYPKGYETL